MNKNIRISEGNIKSVCTDDITFLTWSLPSKITCPYATEHCKKRCFAQKNENFEGVRTSRHRNLEETKKESFVDDMIEHIEHHLNRPKNKNKRIFFRIHTSGDFYNEDYFDKWVKISDNYKNDNRILFQCYTKSIPYLLKHNLKDVNIKIVYSQWNDTNYEHLQSAWNLKLPIFKAVPKDIFDYNVFNGAFPCNGDCGTCKECYTGDSDLTVIPYH